MTVAVSAYRENRLGRIRVADELFVASGVPASWQGARALFHSQFEPMSSEPADGYEVLTGYSEAFEPVPVGSAPPFYDAIFFEYRDIQRTLEIRFRACR